MEGDGDVGALSTAQQWFLGDGPLTQPVSCTGVERSVFPETLVGLKLTPGGAPPVEHLEDVQVLVLGAAQAHRLS